MDQAAKGGKCKYGWKKAKLYESEKFSCLKNQVSDVFCVE